MINYYYCLCIPYIQYYSRNKRILINKFLGGILRHKYLFHHYLGHKNIYIEKLYRTLCNYQMHYQLRRISRLNCNQNIKTLSSMFLLDKLLNIIHKHLLHFYKSTSKWKGKNYTLCIYCIVYLYMINTKQSNQNTEYYYFQALFLQDKFVNIILQYHCLDRKDIYNYCSNYHKQYNRNLCYCCIVCTKYHT